MLLADKVAVVTGAGSGIGRASSLVLAREGAAVVCADINGEGAAETADQITRDGGSARAIQVDVADEAGVKDMIADAVNAWNRLDILFNNAGISLELPITEIPVEEWDRIQAVNLRGTFLGIKHAIPEMLKGGGGSIINTSSDLGIGATAFRSAYCASKAGVILLTKSAAIEWARQGIRVTCICPGVIRTPIVSEAIERGVAAGMTTEQMWERIGNAHPIGRAGEPEEIAEVVAFLASDRASFVTGVAWSVDGGMSAGGGTGAVPMKQQEL